jgi:Putative peptidoglycan binding domain/Chitobiase/beta-hexosaminidase C-terminal domain
MKKILSQISIFLILSTLVILGGFFIKKPGKIGASNSKVITVTFATTPTTATVAKTPLKYNKDFAFSFQMDDASYDNYETGFKYMYGGTSLMDANGDSNLDVYGGLYFTDGSGRSQALSSHPFLGDFVWNSRNYGSNFAVLHPNAITANTFSGTNLLDAYNAGFNVINHSWSHAAVTTLGANYVYSYPSPHGSSTIDYDYELSQNEAEVASFGVPASLTLVPPAGDHGYIDPAFNRGYKFISSESSSFTYSAGTFPVPTDGLNVTNNIDLNHLLTYRKFYDDGRFIPNTTENINTYVDSIASKSRGANKYWAMGFTHRTGYSSGGLNWSNWTTLMDHLATTYGRAGDDSMWMAPAQEVYEYMGVKQNTVVSTNTVGNVMTITLDTSAVPNNYRRYALSMKVTSDAQIQSISYASGEFTAHSENLSTGLINVDWGAVFTSNDFTRAETMVATAESTRLQTSIDAATTYVNYLPASSEKNAFTTRLGNIVVVGKRFLINLGINSATRVQDAVSGSPTNGLWWNELNVNDSFAAERVSGVLYDTSNVASSITVALPQATNTVNDNLKTASASLEGAQATVDGTGLYPNAKMAKGIVIYSSVELPGKLEIRHLDTSKAYRVTLFGNTKNANGGKTLGYFTVQGAAGTTTSSRLQFYNNVGTNVSLSTGGTACNPATANPPCATAIFNSVSPVNTGGANGGVIYITVYDTVTANNITPINVIDISEVTPAKPIVNFTTSTLRSQGTGLVDFNYNLLDDNSSLIDFLSYEYSNTGAFGGEQHTATPKSSDGAHSGISNLTASPTGIAHNFVWDSMTDINGSEGTYYLRVHPHSPTQTGNYYQSSGVALDFKNPVQTNINATTTSTTADVLWSTQENTYSLVDYGLTNSYGSSTGSLSSGSTVMNHDILLSGLSSCTTYHYRISSRDLVGNNTVSSDQIFHTAGCPSPVASPSGGLFNAIQSVTLSATGSSTIRYAIDSGYPADCASGTLYSTAISITVTSTLYVRACDISNNSTLNTFTYTIDTVPPSAPVASPVAGLYNSTQSVTLSASGSDSIRYSTSSLPADCSSGTLYSTAISVSVTSTIYARACDNAGNSSTASFAYTIDTVPPSAPVASPVAGLYNTNQSVSLSAVGSDYIQYALNSAVTDCSSGSLYSTAISITVTSTIYARACDNAGNSSTASFVYTIDKTPPATPDSSPSSGLYNSTQLVVLSASGSDSIRYAMDSFPADCSSGILYTTAISISTTSTIYTRACDNAGNSSTASFVYTIDTDAPGSAVASPIEGLYNSSQSVSLSAAGSDFIRYSLSTVPANCSSGTLYSSSILVSASKTIYVRACDNAGNSSTTSFTYNIDTIPPSTSTTSPVSGLYNSSQSVILSSIGSDYIRYSLTGIPTSCSSDILYTTAISISTTSTIYTRACDNAGNSSTASFVYTIDTVPPSTPFSSPVPGVYGSTQTVSISSLGSDSIRYSTSATPIGCFSDNLYTDTISVSESETIYVRACDNAGNSSTASFAYTIDTIAPSLPTSFPAAGIYNSTQSVTLYALGSDSIRYSIASIPTDCSSGSLYSEPLSVSATVTIYVRACDNVGNSSTASFAYSIDLSSSSNSNNGGGGSSQIVYVSRFVPVYYSNPATIPVGGLMMPAINTTDTHIAVASNTTDIKNNSFDSNKILDLKPEQIVSKVQKISGILKSGDVDADVKILQKFLINQKKGPKAKELSNHALTNNFGNLTKAALKEWQSKNGLPATGTFGPQTRAKIKKLMK